MHQAARCGYYLESQASHRDADGYYTGGSEPDGVWWNPAGLFGLKDGAVVDSATFAQLYEGFSPADGAKLTRNAGNPDRSPGLDITFSPDKSISALWAIAGPELRAGIEAAHHEACREALERVVREYCAYTRIRIKDGIEVVPAEIMGALFQHGASRDNDPELHTHCVILNIALSQLDGKFRAWHQNPAYYWKMAAGAAYRNSFASKLMAQLGIPCERYGRNNEFFRIARVPAEMSEGWTALLVSWSKRRIAIIRKAAEIGFSVVSNAARAAMANTLTRRSKAPSSDREKQLARWQQEASGLIPVEEFIAAITAQDVAISQEQIRAVTEVLTHLPAELTKHEAVVRLPDIHAAVWNATSTVLSGEAVKTAIERVLRSDNVVRLDRPKPSPDSAAGLGHTRLYSTRHEIALEVEIKRMAEVMMRDGGFALPAPAIESEIEGLLAKGYPLSDEQAAAIRGAAGSAGRGVIIEGAAGSGKTTTLKPIADLYRRHGYKMLATAVAWRTAADLGSDCDIRPLAVDKLLRSARRGKLQIDDKTVIFVDEAGMLSSRQTHHIMALSERHGAKIIFAGDTRQQQPVEAGPGLRLVRDIMGSLKIHKIRRQKADLEDILHHVQGVSRETAQLQAAMTAPDERWRLLGAFEEMPDKPDFKPWQVAASEALRDRRAAEAIAAYHDRGHVHLCQGHGAAIAKLVADWDAYRQDNPGKSILVEARTNHDVDALSLAMRELVLAGREAEERVVITVSRGEAQRRETAPLEIARGDLLRLGAAQWDQQLFNGTIVTVDDFSTARDPETGALRVHIKARTQAGRAVAFWHDEIRDFHGNIRLSHGYALTYAAAQGITRDRCFNLTDEHPAAETAYAACTRHREAMDLYLDRSPLATVVHENRHEDDQGKPVTDADILQLLGERWSRDGQKVAAHDHMSEEMATRFDQALDEQRRGWTHGEAADEPGEGANDNEAAGLRKVAATMRRQAADWLHGPVVEHFAQGREDLLATYDDMRAKVRSQGERFVLGDAYKRTLSRHENLLSQIAPYRGNLGRFGGLLSRHGLTKEDLADFSDLYGKAKRFRRRAIAAEREARKRGKAVVEAAGRQTTPAEAPSSAGGEDQKKEAAMPTPSQSPASAVATPPRGPARTTPRRPKAADISAALASQAEAVCRHYLPNGVKQGSYWLIGSLGGEKGQSLFIHLSGPKRGKWMDSATDDHGDLIDLIQGVTGVTAIGDAMDEALRFLGGAGAVVSAQPHRPAEPAVLDQSGIDKSRKLFKAAHAITTDDAAARYLRRRGLSPKAAGGLRLHNSAYVKDGERLRSFPALLAKIETFDGKLETVHRIFLNPDGTPAPLRIRNKRAHKRNMSAPQAGGIWFGNRKAERIVMSEGFEDGLSAIEVLPAEVLETTGFVASASSGRIDQVALSENTKEVVLLQDRGAAGEKTWEKLQARFTDRAIKLSRILPKGDDDLNKDLQELGPEALRDNIEMPLVAGWEKKQKSALTVMEELKSFERDWQRVIAGAESRDCLPYDVAECSDLVARAVRLSLNKAVPEEKRTVLSRLVFEHDEVRKSRALVSDYLGKARSLMKVRQELRSTSLKEDIELPELSGYGPWRQATETLFSLGERFLANKERFIGAGEDVVAPCQDMFEGMLQADDLTIAQLPADVRLRLSAGEEEENEEITRGRSKGPSIE